MGILGSKRAYIELVYTRYCRQLGRRMVYVVNCVVVIICWLGVRINGIDGISGIGEGVLIGWRDAGIGRISGVNGIDGIGGVRGRDIDDVGIGGIDRVGGIREGVLIGWGYVGIKRISGVNVISEIGKAYVDDVGIGVIVNVISEIGKAYVDDVGIGVIDGLGIGNRSACGTSSCSCICH